MSFGLTKQGGYPSAREFAKQLEQREQSQQAVAIFEPPDNQLAMPRVAGPGRIQKHQLICRKCHRPVEKTEQFKEHSGRTVINCAYECHGERGVIRVCEDQWGYDTRMLVLQGHPELCNNQGQPLKIADSSPEPVPDKPVDKPGVIDIDTEVVSGDPLDNMKRLN